jgi:GT2 family glycosyltransferase
MTKNAKMEINLKTCIIILNYNNVEDTIKCIDSIERINTAAIKYIVVDNNTPQKQKIEILSEYLEQNLILEFSVLCYARMICR